MQHDNKWLIENNPFHPESGVIESSDFDELAREYHEHMKAKEAAAESELLANSPEFTCTICNYIFKGSASCKCGMRVTVAMRDAVILQYEQNRTEPRANLMTSNLKLCIDCQHHGHVDQSTPTSWASGKEICKHPAFMYLSDPWMPEHRRKRGQKCGPTGKLFEIKKNANQG